jgi:hypothetical protein
MLTTHFWYGFILGALIIFVIYFVGRLFSRPRSKKG